MSIELLFQGNDRSGDMFRWPKSQSLFKKMEEAEAEAELYPVTLECAKIERGSSGLSTEDILDIYNDALLQKLKSISADEADDEDDFTVQEEGEVLYQSTFAKYLLRREEGAFDVLMATPAPCLLNDPCTGKRITTLYAYINMMAFDNRINIFCGFFLKLNKEFRTSTISENNLRYVTLAKKLFTHINPIMLDIKNMVDWKSFGFETKFCVPFGNILCANLEEWEAAEKDENKRSYAKGYKEKIAKLNEECGIIKLVHSLYWRFDVCDYISDEDDEADERRADPESASLMDELSESRKEAAYLREKLAKKEDTLRETGEKLMQAQRQNEAFRNKALKMQTSTEAAEELAAALSERDTALLEATKLRAALEREHQMLVHAQNKLARPQNMAGIVQWVSDSFQGKLVLTPKAISMLESDNEAGINLDTLCDAVEYLAEEYRDAQRGEKTQEEVLDICSYKYQRHFKVIPYMIDQCTRKEFLDSLSVIWNNERRALNQHLVYGKNPTTLIRIYFFYDKDSGQIVVGGLPRHIVCQATTHI